MKNYLVSGLLGAVGVLASTATNASAAILCNEDGDSLRRQRMRRQRSFAMKMATVGAQRKSTITVGV